MLGQIQDIRVPAFGWHRVALRQGHGRGSTCGCSGKCTADEMAATFSAFVKNRFDPAWCQEVFRRFLDPARIDAVFFHTSSSFEWLIHKQVRDDVLRVKLSN
jgi:hypothetical protein